VREALENWATDNVSSMNAEFVRAHGARAGREGGAGLRLPRRPDAGIPLERK
jgi:hypothetical protein